MNLTEQIISQLDYLMQEFLNYSNEVQGENQRTMSVKADAAAKCAQQKQTVQQSTEALIRQYQSAYQTEKDVLQDDLRVLAGYEQEIHSFVPRSQVQNIPLVSGQFDAADTRLLIDRIKEGGFWAWLKKLLSLGRYSSNKNMAAEAYGQIDNARGYLKTSLAQREKAYKEKVRACEDAARQKIAAIEAQYQQNLRAENQVHASRVSALAQQEQRLGRHPKIGPVQKQLADAIDVLGAKPEGWKVYDPAKQLPPETLLGVILYPCNVSRPTPEITRLLKVLPGYNHAVNGFTIPLTAPMSKPILLYTECGSDDVRAAAMLYQSVVARMIRFMPPKSFRAVFFDPVNRGTALGPLIHLSGEGSGQVCAYYLSAQDINTQMQKLTEHVDKICHRLTGAGCPDINAYNSIPKVARIPYTAVIIHDYPHGFDTSSLEALRILINKSAQCGISIMISHKTGDVAEHKEEEILQLIRQSFHTIEVGGKTKARITLGNAGYAFQPSPVKLEKAYLDSINKHFTYRAPIENSFSKFFGDQTVACRDPLKGLDIPFAVTASGNVLDLQIGYDRAAYGIITGGVGSGKTSLLHMIISSAIMHYRPEDLELWLVDYKEPEFAFYMRNCPPHVRYVVADKSSEISYSILNEMQEEIQRRNRQFIEAGVKDFAEYRQSSYGKTHVLPRLLVVIDEFHRMSQAAEDEPDYKRILENVFSEARSSGVTLLLCDQDISGLKGLTPKSKRLLNVRIALRNSPEEIRETLAAENSQLTDQVKRLILDTSAGLEGSAIYKHETSDENNIFANKVVFAGCRGIFATPDDRTELIANIRERFPSFNRDKTFFVGAARQSMDQRQIEKFECSCPRKAELGDRFYIGTPLGIQPCFFLNLKPGESGENILLVGSNHEKRIAILRATLANAARYGYRVKLFACRAAQLYRQNRDFFHDLPNVEVITSFPEICKYVGETANRLKELYTEEDSAEPESTGADKQLLIFIGLDELYNQMEASPYTQKAAWEVREEALPEQRRERILPFVPETKAAHVPGGTSKPEIVQEMDQGLGNALSGIDALMSSLSSRMEAEAPEENPEETALAQSLRSIEQHLAFLDREAKCDASAAVSIPEKFAGSVSTGIKGYNAIQDLALLFCDGWKLGLNAMAVADRGTAFARMRQLKPDGNFNHRIALTMSPDEALCFMTKAKAMKTLVDVNDTISAVYEYLGGREQCFRPYRFD